MRDGIKLVDKVDIVLSVLQEAFLLIQGLFISILEKGFRLTVHVFQYLHKRASLEYKDLMPLPVVCHRGCQRWRRRIPDLKCWNL